MRIFLDNVEVTPHAQWPLAQLVFRKDEDQYTVAVQLQDVMFYGDAFAKLKAEEVSKWVWNARIMLGGVTLEAKLHKHAVRYGSDRCLVTIDLDNTQQFTRDISGMLVDPSLIEEFPIIIRPKVDKAILIMLLVSTFILLYITAKEIYELGKDIAILAGIAGAGVTGPASSTVAKIAIIALRAAYVAALMVALVNLVRELIDLLARIDRTKAFRLYDALNSFCQRAGYTLEAPTWLRNVWVVSEHADTMEASELFSYAKVLTNSAILVLNQRVKFINLNTVIPSQYRRAFEEYYRYTSDELARRELISLLRDPADSYALTAKAAIEIDRPGLMGFSRKDIPLGTYGIAEWGFYNKYVQAFIKAVGVFSRRVRNLQARINLNSSYVIVEREGFAPKLVYAPNKTQPFSSEVLLQNVYQHYANKQVTKRCENVKMPFNPQDFLDLLVAGMPGVIDLTWKVNDEAAEVTYDIEKVSIATQTYRIV